VLPHFVYAIGFLFCKVFVHAISRYRGDPIEVRSLIAKARRPRFRCEKP